MFGSVDPNTYSGANPDSGISPNNRPNVFQARQVAANAVEFAGVPLDPSRRTFPSPASPLRILRIVNLRVNPAALGGPNSFVPKQITTFISRPETSAVRIAEPNANCAHGQHDGILPQFFQTTQFRANRSNGCCLSSHVREPEHPWSQLRNRGRIHQHHLRFRTHLAWHSPLFAASATRGRRIPAPGYPFNSAMFPRACKSGCPGC